jgi:uncharacterized repeat protein (TIGR02543 family)
VATTSGTITGPTDSKGYRVDISYTITTDDANNRSLVTLTTRLYATTAGYYFSNFTLTTGIRVLDGSFQYTWGVAQNKQYSVPQLGSVQLYSYSAYVNHNSDGTKSLGVRTYCIVDSPASYTFNRLDTPGPSSTNFTTINFPTIQTTPSYSISYDANGGNSTPAGNTYLEGTTITLPSGAGTRTGYTFSGWYDSYFGQFWSGGQAYPVYGNATITAQWTAISYTAYFYSDGSLYTTRSATYGNSVTMPSISKSGYTFNGWSYGGNTYFAGQNGAAMYSDQSYTALWTENAPEFQDQNVTSTLYINQNIQDTADFSVSATNATSYTIEFVSGGQNPTSWLSINNSGNLSGGTNVVGTYTFRIKATSSTGSFVYSSTKTIQVIYPGRRTNNTLGQDQITIAKRWNGSGWQDITFMKRWNGSSWVDLTN